MAQVNASFDDPETVVIRIQDTEFFGLAFDALDEEFEERGMKGGAVAVAELSLRPEIALEVFQTLAKLMKF